MEGPAVHQCKPSRRCRCIQRGRRGTVGRQRAGRTRRHCGRVRWPGPRALRVRSTAYANAPNQLAEPVWRTQQALGRTLGLEPRTADISRAAAGARNTAIGTVRPGGWRHVQAPAVTVPTRSVSRTWADQIRQRDAPTRLQSVPQLAGCRGSRPSSSRLELQRVVPAPQTRPLCCPWSYTVRKHERLPREAG